MAGLGLAGSVDAGHTYAIIEASTKRRVACEQFPTTPAGVSRALAWVGRRTDGDMACLWAAEGIGSYGARLARAVADAGYDVAEAPRMNARGRRAIGKSDPLDVAAIGTRCRRLRGVPASSPAPA